MTGEGTATRAIWTIIVLAQLLTFIAVSRARYRRNIAEYAVGVVVIAALCIFEILVWVV